MNLKFKKIINLNKILDYFLNNLLNDTKYLKIIYQLNILIKS
jgi:hypothetical protein